MVSSNNGRPSVGIARYFQANAIRSLVRRIHITNKLVVARRAIRPPRDRSPTSGSGSAEIEFHIVQAGSKKDLVGVAQKANRKKQDQEKEFPHS